MCLFIDFGEYSNDKAKEYLGSKPKLSLMLAGKFLREIPDNIRNDSRGRLCGEIAIEGFAFFMIAAEDGLYQEINKRLCRMKDHKVHRSTIVKYLGRSNDGISKRIKEIIKNATCKPKWTIEEVSGEDMAGWPSDWDRSMSWLWEIAQLRNTITHRSITNQHVSAGLPAGGVETSIIITKICFNKTYLKKSDGSIVKLNIKSTKPISITEKNPSEYLCDRFKKMERMVSDIQELLDQVQSGNNQQNV